MNKIINKYYFINIIIILIIIIIKNLYRNYYLIKINFNYKKKIFFAKKGYYLSTIGNCISCHTVQGGKPFSGGEAIKTSFGLIYPPNITTNYIHGVGNWKIINFIKALKSGLSKNNNFLYPIFPYIYYSNIKNYDINCMYFFFKTLPSINIPNKINSIKFPYKYKKLLIGWRLMFFNKLNLKLKKQSWSINRGKYIVETLGHCSMCHTKINKIGGCIDKLKYLGNTIEGWYAIPLVNNKFFSIKKRKIQELSKILKYGISKKGIINGSMSKVISNSLQYINKVDIRSICTYIKNIININYIFIKPNLNYNKKISKLFFIKGKLIYKNYCINCHGNLSLGNYPIYPTLLNNIKNNNISKNMLNILIYSSNISTFKKFYTNIMPNFSNIIKYKELYSIINYLYFINNLSKN